MLRNEVDSKGWNVVKPFYLIMKFYDFLTKFFVSISGWMRRKWFRDWWRWYNLLKMKMWVSYIFCPVLPVFTRVFVRKYTGTYFNHWRHSDVIFTNIKQYYIKCRKSPGGVLGSVPMCPRWEAVLGWGFLPMGISSLHFQSFYLTVGWEPHWRVGSLIEGCNK